MVKIISKKYFLPILFIFISFPMIGGSDCRAQDPQFYVLSSGVQRFAIENEIFGKLSKDHPGMKTPARILMYLDSMSFADVISKLRARTMLNWDLQKDLREGKFMLLPQDFELAFSLQCLMPFGPIHERDKGKIIKIRQKLLSGCYTSAGKRKLIAESVNYKLIVMDKKELIHKRIGLFDIINVGKVMR